MRERMTFTPDDVEVAGSVCGQWVHPVIRDPRTRRLMLTAPCGLPAFTEAELARQLFYVRPFMSRRQCDHPKCARVWTWLWLNARR